MIAQLLYEMKIVFGLVVKAEGFCAGDRMGQKEGTAVTCITHPHRYPRQEGDQGSGKGIGQDQDEIISPVPNFSSKPPPIDKTEKALPLLVAYDLIEKGIVG